MSLEFIVAFLRITFIDIVLAGDNAVVIAMAARTLLPEQRQKAIAIGAGLAVVLRVLTTFIVAEVLQLPFLSAAGGILVAWIAVRLLLEDKEVEETHGKATQGFWHAIWIITVADFIMSTDNIIAIGGASRGSFGLILFGLGLSIPIIMLCANWIASLMDRYWWLVYVGAAILGWTAGLMVVDDKRIVALLIRENPLVAWAIEGMFVLGVLGLATMWPRLRGAPVLKGNRTSKP